MKRKITLFLLLLSAVANGLSQESKYLNTAPPDGWSDEEIIIEVLPEDEAWWHRFNDPMLDVLIATARDRNLTVLEAMANIERANATWKGSRANLYPSLDLSLGWQRGKSSGNVATTEYTESWSGAYDASIKMSWQADLFGKIYMRSKAEKELFMAKQEEYNGVLLTLYANVATTYFQLRTALAQKKVVEENCASQKEILNLAEARYKAGLASQLDVAQAQSIYYSTLASLPSINAQIKSSHNRLAVLLGIFPDELSADIERLNSSDTYIEPIAVGVPANLIRRRPDIREAERQVEANAALLGAAKRDWLPEVFLNGEFGFTSSSLKEMPRSRSMYWQIAPTVTFNIFSGGSTVYQTREARAALEASVAAYNNTVLTAVQEVESAISAYKSSVEQIVALRSTVNSGKETLRLSLELYRQGLTQFQNVLDAQRSLLTYQNYLVEAEGSSLTSLVTLYQALGGGW